MSRRVLSPIRSTSSRAAAASSRKPRLAGLVDQSGGEVARLRSGVGEHLTPGRLDRLGETLRGAGLG